MEQRIKDPLLKGAVVFNDMKETQSLAYSSIALQPNLSHCINLTIKTLMLSIKLIWRWQLIAEDNSCSRKHNELKHTLQKAESRKEQVQCSPIVLFNQMIVIGLI